MSIFRDFQQYCPERQFYVLSSETKNHWDTYPIYNDAIVIAKKVIGMNDPKIKDEFLTLLKTIIQYDFSPIIDMIESNETELFYKVEVVDLQDENKVIETANASVDLMTKWNEASWDYNFIYHRLKSPEAFAIVARNKKDEIIGLLIGTNLFISDKNISVFYINVLIRLPNYPINIAKIFDKFMPELVQKYNPDYLSLNANIDNPVIKLYNILQFEQISVNMISFLNKEAAFMVRKCYQHEKPYPTYSDARLVLDSIWKREESNY